MDETNTINIQHPPRNKQMRMETSVTKQLAIEGMTCDKCVQTVERALRSETGVLDVKIDRENSVATVVFDTARTNMPQLHDALRKAGYKATAKADGD